MNTADLSIQTLSAMQNFWGMLVLSNRMTNLLTTNLTCLYRITDGATTQVKPFKPTNDNSNSKNTISGTGGSGSGRSITMNVTLNITNNGLKNPDEFAEQVVRKINDRLNDSIAIAG